MFGDTVSVSDSVPDHVHGGELLKMGAKARSVYLLEYIRTMFAGAFGQKLR